jgi:hypothetical protein
MSSFYTVSSIKIELICGVLAGRLVIAFLVIKIYVILFHATNEYFIILK